MTTDNTQTPVAWQWLGTSNFRLTVPSHANPSEWRPVYAAPQPVIAPQWVGLTDDEIAQGCQESWVTDEAFQSAAWWAEEKLKEKNS